MRADAGRLLNHADSVALAGLAGGNLREWALVRKGGLTWTMRVGDEQELPNFSHGAARGIVSSGVPGAPRPGFGAEPFLPDMRFGTAGAANFLLSLYRHTARGEYLEQGLALADHLIDLGTRDEAGLRWPMEQYDFMSRPGERSEPTGYFHGAAGYGLVLLHAHRALQGGEWRHSLPDSPF